jgi:hypothetical protein
VDRWFASNTFDAREFSDRHALHALKRAQGVTISLGLPALNEEATIGREIEILRRTLMEEVSLLDEIVGLRADAAELASAVAAGAAHRLGGLPEFKAAQARLDELIVEVTRSGGQLKGLAPLLLDFPGEVARVAVLYCWLEGDRELSWYHRADLGFPGRRRL